jgi:formate dehydrogenase subunit delta
MTPTHMLRLANQIALYFASYPREEAIAGITDHMEKFWERRMRQQIVAYVADGGQGLHELALAAVQRLRPVPAARTARA